MRAVSGNDKIYNKIEKDTYGINEVRDGPNRVAYLSNVKTTTLKEDNDEGHAAVICYFYDEEGDWFKSYVKYKPYFYIKVHEDHSHDVISYLGKLFDTKISVIETIEKIDLDDIQHMSGKLSRYIKLSFNTISDLLTVRKEIFQRKAKNDISPNMKIEMNPYNILGCITEIREYDVSYHTRVMIDLGFRVGNWYKLEFRNRFLHKLSLIEETRERPDFVILAYDIETTKLPLKFPKSSIDEVMLISYMINGEGFLITNREIISEDIEDFEYVPNEEFDTEITVFNEANEKAALIKFLTHIQQVKPFIITSFNGDFFDWPFIEERMRRYNIDMLSEIGVTNNNSEYYGRWTIHLDCYPWVRRDSYLPQGSHGLKAVTKYKLYYNPIEVDPEMMVTFAREKPKILCNYSVSDAVATYYLYKKHIHDFIFALCSIIPLGPDDVLRRGSGTLCELLLMAEAFSRNIIFPNKIKAQAEKFYNGHLLDSETYIGGKVECLHNGVYRSDFETDFILDPSGYQEMIKKVDDVIEFFVKVELGKSISDVENYDEVKSQIVQKLSKFAYMESGNITTLPLIYHVDVSAMYPNIILTNRLQPVAIVNEKVCSSCVYNAPENNCKRKMGWIWKAEYFPLTRGEYEGQKLRHYTYSNNSKYLKEEEDMKELKKKVKLYCRKEYKLIHHKVEEEKNDTVCMRENPFYVNTVRAFRDRRYEFKAKVKIWKKRKKQKIKEGDEDGEKYAHNMALLYDSLQLAHKIILNSFYGYVMRKGARWYSMEMAAMVTYTGAKIIENARDLLLKLGKPLELDTDGVWTLLPAGFPENFELKMKNGKTETLEYPCTICNLEIYDKFNNNQYQTENENKRFNFDARNEMTIFFEIDGPYKAMIIPASTEEGKKLKKRYAIFNMKGKLTEVKGFEIKRRGELKIIKIFQEEIFSQFLKGKNLGECYGECAKTANKWLGILINKGGDMTDDEIIELIGESKFLSKNIKDYGPKKGVALTAAKRMAEFLGSEITDGEGLNCKYIISKQPLKSPKSERAVPTSIFKLKEKEIRIKLLRKWLGDPRIKKANLKEILDWDYYIERLGKNIQKMITIVAACQNIENPVPLIEHPDWLKRKINREKHGKKETKISRYFKKKTKEEIENEEVFKNIQKTKSKGTPLKEIKIDKPEVPICKTKIKKNFKKWLKEQKAMWAFKRRRRKAGNYVPVGKSRKRDMDMFLQRNTTYLKKNTWKIIGLQTTQKQGVFRCWAIVAGMYHPIKISVPREIFINTRNSKNFESLKGFKKMNSKVLPRGKKNAGNIFRFVGQESKFRAIENQLELFMLGNEVEGIYQTEVPLEFQFSSNLGNFCVLKNIAEVNNEGCWGFEEMVKLENKQFEINSDEIENIFLGCFIFGKMKIFSVINEKMKTIDVLIEQKNKLLVNKISEMERMIKSEISSKLHQSGSDWTINIQCEKSIKKNLGNLFSDLKEKSKENFLILFQGDDDNLNFCRSQIPDYLIISIGPSTSEEENPKESISIFNWQKIGLTTLINNFKNLGSSFEKRVAISRTANCPLAQIPSDWPTFILDLFYSRIITDKNFNLISWASKNSQPDMGLGEVNYQNQRDMDEFNLESGKKKDVVYTGSIVVQVEIENLEANLLIHNEDLTNSDAQYSLIMDSKKMNRLAEGLGRFPNKAFSILSHLTHQMFTKGQKLTDEIENEVMETVISNISNWISNPNSLFYDPKLEILFKRLLDKSFQKLLDTFRSFGATILYADTTKILIDTNKRTLSAAKSYIHFLIESIEKINFFNFIEMVDEVYWNSLVFKDEYNFCGIDADTDEVTIVWKEAEVLPEAMKKQFYHFIEKFMRVNIDSINEIFKKNNSGENKTEITMIEIKDEVEKKIKNDFQETMILDIFDYLKSCKESLRQYELRKSNMDEEILALEGNEEYNSYLDEEEEMIDGEMDDFIDYDDENSGIPVKKIFENNHDEGADFEFLEFGKKVIPGEKDKDISPLKTLIEIFSDIFYSIKFLKNEANLLTQITSKLTGKEVSTTHLTSDPLIRLVLPGTPCTNCPKLTDLDVFRAFDSKSKNWVCPGCGEEFDTFNIEMGIIEWINVHISAIKSQSIVCKSSKTMRVDYLSTVSEFGGEYILRKDFPSIENFKLEVKNGFEDLMILADMNKMHHLKDVISSL